MAKIAHSSQIPVHAECQHGTEAMDRQKAKVFWRLETAFASSQAVGSGLQQILTRVSASVSGLLFARMAPARMRTP